MPTTDNDIIKAIASLETKIDGIDKRLDGIDDLRKTIYGNGQIGLKGEVAVLTDKANRFTWLIRAIMVAIIGLMLAQVYNMINSVAEWKAIQTIQRLQGDK